jgi:hypothetical protein
VAESTRDDLAEIIIPAAQSGRGATNTGGPVSPDDQAVSSRVSSQARDDLDRALWQGRTLRGLADAASPQTRRELVDTIIAAGWRPPLPDDVVRDFCAERAGFITAINNCHPDNDRDYWRWQGHAESRRQLSERLGLPTAWPAEVRP